MSTSVQVDLNEKDRIIIQNRSVYTSIPLKHPIKKINGTFYFPIDIFENTTLFDVVYDKNNRQIHINNHNPYDQKEDTSQKSYLIHEEVKFNTSNNDITEVTAYIKNNHDPSFQEKDYDIQVFLLDAQPGMTPVGQLCILKKIGDFTSKNGYYFDIGSGYALRVTIKEASKISNLSLPDKFAEIEESQLIKLTNESLILTPYETVVKQTVEKKFDNGPYYQVTTTIESINSGFSRMAIFLYRL